MRFKYFVLFSGLALILGPAPAKTQWAKPLGQPSVKSFPMSGYGGGGYSYDPSEMYNRAFDRFANGKDVVSSSDITNPHMQKYFDSILQQAGITSGQMTRQQYVDYWKQRTASYTSGGFSPPAVPSTPVASTTVDKAQWGRPWSGASAGTASPYSGYARGGYSYDPNEAFNRTFGRYANGKDVVSRSDITDPYMQNYFDYLAKQAGVTDGQMTRQQYADYMQQLRSGSMSRPMSAPSSPSTPAPQYPVTPSSGTTPQGPGTPSSGTTPQGPGNVDAIAESMFRRQDANGDSLLNNDEMPGTLRAERDRWDTNKDGFIDLAEYKEYYKARISPYQGGQYGGAPGWTAPPAAGEDEEERRPVVYRAGKLPPNLPSWFSQCDRDQDGQVGLYEWKASGRSFQEFAAFDRNGDGFITAEEALRPATAPPSAGSTAFGSSSQAAAFPPPSTFPVVSPPSGTPTENTSASSNPGGWSSRGSRGGWSPGNWSRGGSRGGRGSRGGSREKSGD
jgi:hypothetical protein